MEYKGKLGKLEQSSSIMVVELLKSSISDAGYEIILQYKIK